MRVGRIGPFSRHGPGAKGLPAQKPNVTVIGSALRPIDPTSSLTGTYEFDNPVDMATVATRRFEVDVEVGDYVATDLIDSRGNVDIWASVDGGTVVALPNSRSN
jgi:hypothetical protein